ncbi:alpha/beta fold hydrolase [Leptospira sp. 96542]|nr:alpha/beta fold hydrolase [Leptospira sp. 96542]
MNQFKPPKLLSASMVQSFLASYKSNRDKKLPFLDLGKWDSAKTSEGIVLLAQIHINSKAKGCLFLLHGWEGSIHSSYIVRTAQHFFNRGFNIIRLNLRDHGDTHHLNEGLFNGSLLKETYEAVGILANRYKKLGPFYMAGFSLGGNFALRIATKHSLENKKNKIPNLKYCFSFSPALDPKLATIKMDNNPILRKYFLKSWKTSLLKKQNFFPHLYSFGDLNSYQSVMDLTEKMVKDFSNYKSVDDYFASYTLSEAIFSAIKVPCLVLSAKDDPVIPWENFLNIPKSKYLNVIIEEKGGHCGFIENIKRDSYYWKLMENKMG